MPHLFLWMEVTAVTDTAISTLKSSIPCQATKRTAKNPTIWKEGAAAAATSAAQALSLEVVDMPLWPANPSGTRVQARAPVVDIPKGCRRFSEDVALSVRLLDPRRMR